MSSPDGPRTGRPTTRGERGMVTTSHHLATAAGVAALRQGGSAVDAAIAANVVLCVAYPHMAGIGGDGFWLVKAPDAAVRAINASDPAAGAATRERYRSLGHDRAIPARGPLAALTVPGAVDGWRLAHEAHGRLDWSTLFADGIALARTGVPVGRSLADWSAKDASLLRTHDVAASIFLPGGRPPREGDRLVQADLAGSLQAIAAGGARSTPSSSRSSTNRAGAPSS